MKGLTASTGITGPCNLRPPANFEAGFSQVLSVKGSSFVTPYFVKQTGFKAITEITDNVLFPLGEFRRMYLRSKDTFPIFYDFFCTTVILWLYACMLVADAEHELAVCRRERSNWLASVNPKLRWLFTRGERLLYEFGDTENISEIRFLETPNFNIVANLYKFYSDFGYNFFNLNMFTARNAFDVPQKSFFLKIFPSIRGMFNFQVGQILHFRDDYITGLRKAPRPIVSRD